MTRLFLVGDTHGNAGFWKQAFKFAAAEDADYIIQLGDFGIWPGIRGHEYLDRLQKWSVRAGIPVLVVPGNHDDWDQIDALESEYIRDNIRILGKVNTLEFDGVKFLTVGGAVSIDRQWRKPGVSWWSQEMLTDEDVAAAQAVGKVDVLLTHDASNALPSWEGFIKNDPASNQNRFGIGLIEDTARPEYWFHGHYHRFLQYEGTHGAKVTALDSEPMGAMGASEGTPPLNYWRHYKPFAVLDTHNGSVSHYIPDFTESEIDEVYR